MAKRKAKPKGAHKMPGGAMMKDSEMKGMTKGAKPKFGTPGEIPRVSRMDFAVSPRESVRP